MYFAILGKHQHISIAELHARIEIMTWIQYGDIVLFDTNQLWYEKLKTLWWIIKYGVVKQKSNLYALVFGKCVGVADQYMGTELKSEYHAKRYKIVWLQHTDLEVKDYGIEIIKIDKDRFGVVEWYQTIDLYTYIDIEKPSSGMNIGMMPAKLTHILINLALGTDCYNHVATIYDPMCGFGTTLMLANTLWYHALWSDINITQSKLNLKRWKQQPYYQSDRHMTVFKHDVFNPFDHPLIRQVDCIVSEWRLGPIVWPHTHTDQYIQYSKDIVSLYQGFIHNIYQYHIARVVMTIPHYILFDQDFITQSIEEARNQAWYRAYWIPQLYHRSKQFVARKIGVFDYIWL